MFRKKITNTEINLKETSVPYIKLMQKLNREKVNAQLFKETDELNWHLNPLAKNPELTPSIDQKTAKDKFLENITRRNVRKMGGVYVTPDKLNAKRVSYTTLAKDPATMGVSGYILPDLTPGKMQHKSVKQLIKISELTLFFEAPLQVAITGMTALVEPEIMPLPIIPGKSG